MSRIKSIKDRFYYLSVDRNRKIARCYHAFVDADPERHRKHPLGSYWYLLKLNLIFRLLGGVEFEISATQAAKKARESNQKPYLDGAESEAYPRLTPVALAHKFNPNYDLISFDIFDTLIIRPFAKPADLFLLVGAKLQIPKFPLIRITAEREAREIALGKYGNREVTIHDIYARVAVMTGLDPEFGVKTEFETELELCRANPYMLQVFKLLRAVGKKIIAVSDMYLPKEYMTRLLEKCGYSGFDNVFVSCDHNLSKRDGGLFSLVKMTYPNANMIHLGDKPEIDVAGCRIHDIKSSLYRAVNDIGAPFRPKNMSRIIGSAYSGIVNAHLHNGKHQYSVPYEFGFIYGGIYLLGYCHWIHEYCLNNKMDKVLFLSRDGEIISRVFQMMYDDIPSELFYWNRSARIRYLFDYNRFHCVTQILRSWTWGDSRNASKTVRQMFEALSFPKSAYDDLPKYRMRPDDFTCSVQSNLNRFLFDHVDLIQKAHEAYADEKEALKEYVRKSLGDSKRVVIADIGSTGESTTALKRLIEEEVEPEVECSVVLGVYFDAPITPWSSLQNQIRSYVCSSRHNRTMYDDFLLQKGFPYLCFELLHEALLPSFHGMSVEGGNAAFRFQPPEVENYPVIRELQKGIMDFCRIYRDTFRNYPFMFNISAEDAIAPYHLLSPYVTDFMSRHFPDYVHGLCIPMNGEAESMLFHDIIMQAHV